MKRTMIWKLATVTLLATTAIFAYLWLRPAPRSALRFYVRADCEKLARQLREVQAALKAPTFDRTDRPMIIGFGFLQSSAPSYLQQRILFCGSVHTGGDLEMHRWGGMEVQAPISQLGDLLIRIDHSAPVDLADRAEVARSLDPVIEIVDEMNQRPLLD